MILLAVILVYFNDKNLSLKINPHEWTLLISGSVVVILSFIMDCYQCIRLYKGQILDAISQYKPQGFDWWIFWLGEGLILAAIFMFYFRAKNVLSGTK
jgi:hypothetical protein